MRTDPHQEKSARIVHDEALTAGRQSCTLQLLFRCTAAFSGTGTTQMLHSLQQVQSRQAFGLGVQGPSER